MVLFNQKSFKTYIQGQLVNGKATTTWMSHPKPLFKKQASRNLNKEKNQTWFMVSTIQIGQVCKMETFSKSFRGY